MDICATKKTRNRKKCKRQKKVKENITVKLTSSPWENQNGIEFCQKRILTNIQYFDSSTKLLFEMITRSNANAFIHANKEDPRCRIFIKEFIGYISGVCKRWKEFKIGKSFNKTVPKLDNCSIESQVDKSVSYCQLRAFLKEVMAFLFTDHLLGEENTKLFINKLVHSYFNVRMIEPVLRKSYVLRNIQLMKVPWLTRFSFETARVLLQCVIKFLCSFFQQIIYKSFHIVFDNTEKMRFYRIEIWNKLSAHFLERFIEMREGVLLQTLPNDHYYQMWFIPKSRGFRPIEQLVARKEIRCSPDVEAREFLRIVNRVLLRVTNSHSFGFGIHDLHQFGHQLRIFGHQNQNIKEFYCFSGDITNCYPSIKHDFLTKALNAAIPDEGPFIYAKYWVKQNDKNRLKFSVGVKTLQNAEWKMRKKYGHISQPMDMKRITKKELIQTIQRYAMKNVVKCGSKIYRCNCGIPQGSALSVLLCKIYLAQMENELFTTSSTSKIDKNVFGGKALLVRYVDDYFLISTEKQLAEAVIQRLTQDSKNFNMSSNEEKTFMTSNLSHLRNYHLCLSKSRIVSSGERINWCGFAVNTITLTIAPDMNRFKKRKCTFNIPIKLMCGPFLSAESKQKERCEWVLKKIKQALISKRDSMRLCRRIYRRKARRTPIFNSVMECIKKFYLKYFQRRLGIQSSNYFKPIAPALRNFVKTFFKRRIRVKRLQDCVL